ncbi:MAG: cysteine synthase A [Chitinophagaceae bacterium]|nr:cysteine synthase A [Oligoflexus sp.]
MKSAFNQLELVGRTPLLRIESLSRLTGSDIFVKCEFMNPGGSVKDRAAKFMIEDALVRGDLKPGMTVIEGTAGNTGIGIALVSKVKGLKATVVMPKGQTIEKVKMVSLYGAELVMVDAVPFANPNHFYHTARRIAEENPKDFWWANQFENLSNFKAHYTETGPEIWEQTEGRIDAFVTSAGTGGTLAGVSRFLKEQNKLIKTALVDPNGSGLYSFVKTGTFASKGSSITEGIGIMRLVANFKEAELDDAYQIPDQELVTIAQHVRDHDGLLLGSSSALNVAAAYRMARSLGRGKRIVTIACDLGERSASKLYNNEYLTTQGLKVEGISIKDL